MTVNGGIRTNYRGETGLKGLYAAGDDVWVTISHAATFGWSAGENAAKYAETVKLPDIEEAKAEIEAKKAMLEEIRNRQDGAKWQEALAALQQIMLDYCGYVRSESLLSAGIDIMGRLKNKAQTFLIAGNAHELMNCLQVLNLIDLGELVFISAYDRQETRGWHVRSDYTITNPLLSDKIHLVKQVDGKPVTEWIEVKR
jgi:succinate dehydrogenase/fumarate reductase flavoprotein subunit